MKIAEHFDKPSRIERILIIQLGDIGDVVWSLPALRAVREAYPDADVAMLLREGNGGLLAADISPPEIFEVKNGGRGSFRTLSVSLGLIRELRRKRFDLVFDLRGDERGGYTARLTGAPIRVAQYYPGLSWIRNRMFTHLTPLSDGEPGERAAGPSMSMLRAFAIETGSTVPELHLSEQVRLRAAKILREAGVHQAVESVVGGGVAPFPARSRFPWVTVNPFSRWSYKEWSPEKWVRVIDWLWRELGVAAVIVGSPPERARSGELMRGCGGKVFNLAGRTTLAELAGVLEKGRLHIGVDSAAPHIAAAVGTPTVTLYGPSNWRYWAPPGKDHRVAVCGMACAPCGLKGCDGSGVSRCMDDLTVEKVQAVLREALAD